MCTAAETTLGISNQHQTLSSWGSYLHHMWEPGEDKGCFFDHEQIPEESNLHPEHEGLGDGRRGGRKRQANVG